MLLWDYSGIKRHFNAYAHIYLHLRIYTYIRLLQKECIQRYLLSISTHAHLSPFRTNFALVWVNGCMYVCIYFFLPFTPTAILSFITSEISHFKGWNMLRFYVCVCARGASDSGLREETKYKTEILFRKITHVELFLPKSI